MPHRSLLALSVSLAALAGTAGCVVEQRVPTHGRPVDVAHGRVVRAELVERPSAAQEGAVVGGLLGFMLSGRSAPEKILGTIWGAAAGSAVAEQNAGPRQAWAYTVQLLDGRTQRVLTERPDLREGDCVAVESARYVNLRRVSDALCEPPRAPPPPVSSAPPEPQRPPDAAPSPPAADPSIEEKVQAEASSCEAAKEQLEKSKSREETEAALRKVHVFCDM